MGDLRRVLIVDDCLDNVEVLSLLLVARRCCTVGVGTGRAGLTMASVFGPDVVLLDLTLPDMCGFSVAQQLRAAHAKLRIVVVTGWYMPGITARVRASGADAYRLKPVDIDEIARLIHTKYVS